MKSVYTRDNVRNLVRMCCQERESKERKAYAWQASESYVRVKGQAYGHVERKEKRRRPEKPTKYTQDHEKAETTKWDVDEDEKGVS